MTLGELERGRQVAGVVFDLGGPAAGIGIVEAAAAGGMLHRPLFVVGLELDARGPAAGSAVGELATAAFGEVERFFAAAAIVLDLDRPATGGRVAEATTARPVLQYSILIAVFVGACGGAAAGPTVAVFAVFDVFFVELCAAPAFDRSALFHRR